MAAAVRGLSPVIITVRMPMARKRVEALLDAALHHVLQVDDAEHARAVARRPAACRPTVAMRVTRCVDARPASRRRARSRACGSASTAPLRMHAAVEVAAAHARLRRERDERRAPICVHVAPAQADSCSLASTTIERPSGVSSARLASCAASASASGATPRRRDELGGHAVAERDGAGLVEQQRVDVARRLDGAAAHRDARSCAAGGPCRRCRWPRAGRRSWSG